MTNEEILGLSQAEYAWIEVELEDGRVQLVRMLKRHAEEYIKAHPPKTVFEQEEMRFKLRQKLYNEEMARLQAGGNEDNLWKQIIRKVGR